MICPVCNGDGWLRSKRDVSRIYGYEHSVTTTRVCPNCFGKCRVTTAPPLDGKALAAGEGNGDGDYKHG